MLKPSLETIVDHGKRDRLHNFMRTQNDLQVTRFRLNVLFKEISFND